MSGYIGTQPVPQASQTRDSFTCTAGQTSFATSGYMPSFLDVYLNGVKLTATDYTASNGSDVVLAFGAAAGDVLEVVAYTAFEAANVTGATDFTVTGSFTSQGIDDNATSTAMTLDSSGNLLVGTTDNANTRYTATSGGGTVIQASSFSVFSRETTASNQAVMTINNTGVDAISTEFLKNGTTVGSIGVINSNNLTINGNASNHTGLQFGTSIIWPMRDAANADGTVDLGTTTGRFKDLYLSGGVYLGGVGSANKLDDYEEGTWTPTLTSSSMGTSITYSSNTYVKVGKIVQLQAVITMAGTSGNTVLTDYFQLGGLPFTNNNMGNGVWWQSTSYATGVRNSGHCMIAGGTIYGGCEYVGSVGRQVSITFSLTYEAS
jgi:hypothetical protein